jgi:hypothetical protein
MTDGVSTCILINLKRIATIKAPKIPPRNDASEEHINKVTDPVHQRKLTSHSCSDGQIKATIPEASLKSDSFSKVPMTLVGTSILLVMELTATASVGVMMAPKAKAKARAY